MKLFFLLKQRNDETWFQKSLEGGKTGSWRLHCLIVRKKKKNCPSLVRFFYSFWITFFLRICQLVHLMGLHFQASDNKLVGLLVGSHTFFWWFSLAYDKRGIWFSLKWSTMILERKIMIVFDKFKPCNFYA